MQGVPHMRANDACNRCVFRLTYDPCFPAVVLQELREASGAGMMDCKKALAECNGDIEKAKEVGRQ